MSVELAFSCHISKIKRWLVIQALHHMLLNASVIFLSVSAVLLILAISDIIDFYIVDAWYLIPLGISLPAALIIAFLSRSKFLDVLIDIDRRLKLQDRLSTAYEHLQFKKQTEFMDLLLNDAEANLRQFSKQQIVPVKFTFVHLLAIILLLINIFLYSKAVITSDLKSPPSESQQILHAQKLLKNYMIGRIENKAASQSIPQSDYTTKLEKFSNELNTGSKPLAQHVAELDRFLKEVQGEQTRLANELSATLESDGIKDFFVQKVPDLTNLSSDQLKKLKKLLNHALNNRMPDSINQNIESLQELDRIEKLISRIISDIKDGKSLPEDYAESVEDEWRMSQSTESIKNPINDPSRIHADGKFAGNSQHAADRPDHPGIRGSHQPDDDRHDRMGQPDGHSASAGRAGSKGESQSGHELKKSPGPAIQDKTTTSLARSYLIQIRALTDIGEARLDEEEIFRTYRQEVESILQKEDIPINYRKYIKNYFISIGINTDQNANEIQ